MTHTKKESPYLDEQGLEIHTNMNHSTGNTKVQAASEFATKYGAIFPLEPNSKKPLGKLVPHGFQEATTDLSVILDWWRQEPNANIGLATGLVSNIIVIDEDPRNGGDESLKAQEARLGKLPNTLTVITGGGGHHYYFKYPSNKTIKSRSGIAPGLDIKSDGGYVVMPYSVHESGGLYTFENQDVEIAELSEPWIDYLCTKVLPVRSNTDPDFISEGERNSTLTSIAGTLRRQGLTEDEILTSISLINNKRCNPSLEESELRLIARSISRYEAGGQVSSQLPNKEFLDIKEIDRRIKSEAKQASMNFNLLPKPFLDYMNTVKDSTAAPDEFLVLSYIGLIAAAMGKEIVLEWPLGYIKPHVWIACIAPSGVKKTTALTITKKLCSTLEKERRNLKRHKLKQYDADYAKYCSLLKKGEVTVENEPEYPSVRTLLLPTLTSKEKLYTTLSKDYAGGVIYEASELSTLLYDWKQERNSGMVSTMMSLFDSNEIVEPPSYKNSEELPLIENPAVSILGASVDKTFFKRFGEEDFDGGLLQRWLIGTTNCTKKAKGWPKTLPFEELKVFQDLVEKIFYLSENSGNQRLIFKLDSEVQQYWDELYDHLDDDYADETNETLLSCYRRINDTYILKLALIFECTKAVYDQLLCGKSLMNRITKESIDEAVALSKYFKDGMRIVLTKLENNPVKRFIHQIVFKLRSAPDKRLKLSDLKNACNAYREQYSLSFDQAITALHGLDVIALSYESNQSHNGSITEIIWLLEQ